MDLNQTVLYEDFQEAQQAAVEVTDRYRDTPADDPRKDALWREVVSRTELSHRLLKRWLAEVEELEPVLSRPA
jgi:CHASE3 domain sensor protein